MSNFSLLGIVNKSVRNSSLYMKGEDQRDIKRELRKDKARLLNRNSLSFTVLLQEKLKLIKKIQTNITNKIQHEVTKNRSKEDLKFKIPKKKLRLESIKIPTVTYENKISGSYPKSLPKINLFIRR